jgi:hypothetical protein
MEADAAFAFRVARHPESLDDHPLRRAIHGALLSLADNCTSMPRAIASYKIAISADALLLAAPGPHWRSR